MSYPTWVTRSPARIESEEGQQHTFAFVPDFIILREDGKWLAKWRTSARWDGPYDTAAQARQAIERSLASPII